MSPEPSSAPPAAGSQVPALEAADAAQRAGSVQVARGLVYFFLAVSGVALTSTAMLWQKLSTIQEQLARQSQEAGGNATAARALAREAQEVARESAARQALTEQKLNELALQRTQVEELIHSVSRSRDENLVVDIESGLRLAQQQAQLTGSAEPLLAELRSADKRLERAAQPRLSRVRAAIARDIERVRAASTSDVPGVLAKLDELSRLVDELPLANAVPAAGAGTPAKAGSSASRAWWETVWTQFREEARSLVRVSRIDQPEAVLLAPEHGFFLRENLKFKLLNARLGLLARQTDSARADVAAAMSALRKYFDPQARRTQHATALLQQVQSQLRTLELPRVDETLAVLAAAAAGR
jgi:uroporphyrin-III C-methyltransferase